MHRIPLIVGNWKMYKTAQEARTFIAALSPEIAGTDRRVLIAAPFTAIEGAGQAAKDTRILIGAQNMHDHPDGAYTGEVSASMLKSIGARFVILGHSERRLFFGEDNAFIRRKVLRALAEGLLPILCIGEQLHEREAGMHEEVLRVQLDACLHGLTQAQMSEVVIAYEPVWAIGTGKTATPDSAQEVHRFIRSFVEERFGSACSQKISLLYGGSVKPDNMAALMEQTAIDGVLVGGASLDVEAFAQIVNY